MRKLTARIKMTCLLLTGIGMLSLGSGEPSLGRSTSESESEKPVAYEAMARHLYEAVLNTGNLDRASKFIAPNYINHNPFGAELAPGLEGFKQGLTIFRIAFPDLHFAVEELIVKEEIVIARVTMSGTHMGTFMGITPTGKRVEMTRIDIFRVANGVIVERWGTFDGLTLMEQFGIVDSMAWQDVLSSSEPPRENDQIPHKTDDVPQGKSQRPPMIDLQGFEQLRHMFQNEIGKIRLIALLSPG